MTSQAIKSYIKFDFQIISREKLVIALIVLLPGLMYAFFGLMFGGQTYDGGQSTFYDEYTASFSGLILLNVALMNIGPVLTIYREMGFFRRLMVTPLPMSAIWMSTLLRSALIFGIGQAEMLLLGYLMFDRLPDASSLELGIAVIISMWGLFSMGFLIGSVMRSSNAAFNAGILLFQPMLLLSGASFPLSMFPQWMQPLIQLIPMTHVVELLRLAWKGNLFTVPAVWPTVFLVIFGSVCSFIAQQAFRRASI
jgi:ABC-2 type transport system permease protein